MCYLSDRDIRDRLRHHDPAQRIVVEPIAECAVQPASIDVRLGNTLLRPDTPPDGIIDPMNPQTILMQRIEFGPDSPVYHMRAGEKLLGATYEEIAVPADLVAKLDGKSSIARLFLQSHVTAGVVDPGWTGKLTFEFVNINDHPIRLTHGMPIAQLLFATLTSPAARPYGHPDLGSKYQGDTEPTESRYHLNTDGNHSS